MPAAIPGIEMSLDADVAQALPGVRNLDDQIKEAQLEKLHIELRNLNTWNYELTGKVVISVLAVALAIWSVYIGVPKAQYDALKATQEVASTSKRLDDLKSEAERKTKELSESNEALEQRKRQLADANDALSRSQNALQAAKPALTGAALAEVDDAAKPVVYVQFAGGLSREFIDAYRSALDSAGFSPPRAERINRGQKNEVRYFSSSPQGTGARNRCCAGDESIFRPERLPFVTTDRAGLRPVEWRQAVTA